jgi:hypothetical protein
MPKPIVCLSEQLHQFLEAFRPCFSNRQWKYFATVFLGLIECEERKTMTGLLRGVGEGISLSGLSRFMSWIAEDGRREWLSLPEYAARLGPEDWQVVTWPSTQGGQQMYTHLIPT